MAEATGLRNAALPYPVYGAPYAIVFPLLDADGDPVSPSSPDSEISKNGDTFADCTNEATEIATSSGICYLQLTATEMTADVVAIRIQSTGAKTTVMTLYPRKLPTLNSGTVGANAGDGTTLQLAAGAVGIDDFYNGCLLVGTIDTVVEARVISDYVGSTLVCTVSPAFNTAPDNNDTYVVYQPEGRQVGQATVVGWVATAIPGVDTAGYPKVTIKDGTGTGEIDTTSGGVLVAAIASGAITATSIAADAITAAKIADGAIDRATFAADTGLQTIRSNTAQSGAAGSVTLDASASATTDFYKGSWIFLTGGTGVGQTRLCTAYNGTSKVATITPNWATNPDATSTFAVLPAAGVDLELIANAAVSTSTAQLGVNAVQAGGTAWGSGAITAAAIASNAITSAKIAASAIGASQLASNAITSAKIAAGAITSTGIAASAIGASQLATGAITNATFAAGAIDAAAIAADAIGASELAADAATEIGTAVWATAARTLTAATNITSTGGTTVPQTGDSYARLGAPAGASVSADVAAVKTDTGNILTKLLKYVQLLVRKDAAIATDNATELTAINANGGSGGGSFDNTTDSEQAIRDNMTTPPTAAAIADQVWEEAIADHSGTTGSTAEALNSAGSAGDPWTTALPGAYGAGSAGKIIGDNINATISSRASQTSVDTIDDYVDTEIAAIKAKTDNLPSDPADASDIAASFSTVNSTLSTIAGYIDTEVAAIKAKTDNLPAAPAAVGDIPTAVQNADALLGRNINGGSSTGRTVKQALRALRNKVTRSGGTITVYQEDDTTSDWTASYTTDDTAEPITEVDPS